MVHARWSILPLVLAAAACGPQPITSVEKEQRERDELINAMKANPALAHGETRNGPDSALLPPPGKPDPDANHQHHQSHDAHSN